MKTKNLIITVLCALIIVAGALLALTRTVAFTPEFAGGTSVLVTMPEKATAADLKKASDAVGKVSMSQILNNNTILVETARLTTNANGLKAQVAKTMGVEESSVSVALNKRLIDKAAITSTAISLLIAGAVAIVYFAIRFGVVCALVSIFGFATVGCLWIIPYACGIALDYKAFTVLAIGLAAFAIQIAVVFGKRVKSITKLDAAPSVEPVAAVGAAGVLASVIVGAVAGIWAVAVPLAVVFAGSTLAAVFAVPAFIGLFKK